MNELLQAFLLGNAAILTNVCILPLYPGLIAFLAGSAQGERGRKAMPWLGLLVLGGVLSLMLVAGWLLQEAGADARTRSIRITDSGRAKHAEAQRRWKLAQTGVNQLLGAERVAALHTLIDDCTALLESADAA